MRAPILSLHVLCDVHHLRYRGLILAMFFAVSVSIVLSMIATDALAHGVTEGDKGYIQEISGIHLLHPPLQLHPIPPEVHQYKI